MELMNDLGYGQLLNPKLTFELVLMRDRNQREHIL